MELLVGKREDWSIGFGLWEFGWCGWVREGNGMIALDEGFLEGMVGSICLGRIWWD